MGVMKTEQDGAYRAVQPNSEGKLPVVKVWDEASGKYVPVMSVTGGGVELPELTNPGVAENLLTGTQLIDQEGNVVDGAMPVCGKPSISYQILAEDTISVRVSMDKGYNSRTAVSGQLKPAVLAPDLLPENIAYGKTIFGVTGTLGGYNQVRAVNHRTSSGQTLKVTYANSDETTTTITIDPSRSKDFMCRIGGLIAVEFYSTSHTLTTRGLNVVLDMRTKPGFPFVVYQVMNDIAVLEVS